MSGNASRPDDAWLAGDAYEAYMGRWSRPIARAFVAWLAPPAGARWLEIGCGTGALTAAVCAAGAPAAVVACDPAAPFVAHARRHVGDARVTFAVAGADALPAHGTPFDFAVSGLVLNFVPEPAATIPSWRGHLRAGGTVAAYVWDYADGMQFLRRFWDAAAALDPRAAALDEGARFPLCGEDALARTFRAAGLADVRTQALEVPTTFESFEDFWAPFLSGTGPAPGYVASLAPEAREALRRRLAGTLPADANGRITLGARAWAVRGEFR